MGELLNVKILGFVIAPVLKHTGHHGMTFCFYPSVFSGETLRKMGCFCFLKTSEISQNVLQK